MMEQGHAAMQQCCTSCLAEHGVVQGSGLDNKAFRIQHWVDFFWLEHWCQRKHSPKGFVTRREGVMPMQARADPEP
jgi:hypothetical protein